MNKYKSEELIQQESYIAFNNKYPELRGLLFSVPNGGFRLKREAKILKATGLVSGVSDMIFIYKGTVYCFEFKTITGYQSNNQKIWEQKVKKQGINYFIVRSKEQFMNILKEIICY